MKKIFLFLLFICLGFSVITLNTKAINRSDADNYPQIITLTISKSWLEQHMDIEYSASNSRIFFEIHSSFHLDFDYWYEEQYDSGLLPSNRNDLVRIGLSAYNTLEWEWYVSQSEAPYDTDNTVQGWNYFNSLRTSYKNSLIMESRIQFGAFSEYILEQRLYDTNTNSLPYGIEYPKNFFYNDYLYPIAWYETIDFDERDNIRSISSMDVLFHFESLAMEGIPLGISMPFDDLDEVNFYEWEFDIYLWYDMYDKGYSDGYDYGFDGGTDYGLEIGREEGYDYGYDYGFDEGYEKGISESEGYDKGYQDGSTDSFLAKFDKWIVPAIISILFVSGFFAFRGLRKRHEE